MKGSILAIGFLAVQLAASALADQHSAQPPSPAAANPPASADTERRDLIIATQQAAGSRVDFVRALEEHLKKYPNSPYREKILRSLFLASKELNDPKRIATYGEQLLAKDPNDVSVLPAVGQVLNQFENVKASERALQIGQQLEKEIRGEIGSKEGSDPGAKTQQELKHARDLGIALTIEADAYGITGRTQDAVSAAKEAFAAFPSADAARSLGRWEAHAGHIDSAVRAYADAFALGDSSAHHADDRRLLSELYRKDHSSTAGLGDVVLAEYDRMISRQEALDPQSASANPLQLQNSAITDMSGKRVPLSSFNGKVVVMDFWATWCHPCRIQHPLFEQVKRSFQNDPRVVFLEVDSGEDRVTVEPFLQKQGWNGNVYLDNNLAQILNIESIPTTILVDRKGNVYSELVGFRPETFVALLTSRIQDALAKNAEAPSQVN